MIEISKTLKNLVPNFGKVYVQTSKAVGEILEGVVKIFEDLLNPILAVLKDPELIAAYLVWKMMQNE